ncbi:hypothetical protein BDF22DRAFT_739165 [Syncephalis plumigaleata]|nr:hypothetical protein BDF22DRAFT_739165 [Syncephalis plumigaleata]
MSIASIEHNQHYDEAWAHNATRFWGIPMHPTSQQSIFDYVVEPVDAFSLQSKYFSTFDQTQLHILPGWCCLLSSLFGTSLAVLYAFAMLVPGINLYLVLRKRRWVFIVGTLFNTLHLGLAAILFTSSVIKLMPYYGCVINYISLAPLLCVTTTTPQSVLFLYIFSYIAYQQYRKLGLRAWKQLTKDGIRAMILVLVANLLCNVTLSTQAGRDLGDLLFYIDWILTLTILTNYCVNVCNAANLLKEDEDSNSDTTRVDIIPTITSSYGRFLSNARLTSYFNIKSK